ncbi:hypothetical protein HHK36_024063 [Tetracentron sinense]|uniref:J domain-containing protein n=1 Tax=Tetracentron sinense TaxID=13715 RepID=A0A835D3X7_TETSI|nr:hypothetical protein HHK36_024063 [Tetracentron sinense]
MISSSLLQYTPFASTIIKPANPRRLDFYPQKTRKFTCKASSSPTSITDLDLYDLLGIDSSSDLSQIKMAYRSLQKRCHPDIAGPPGHDMAIILNEAYSVLSDPNLRFTYDKEHVKTSELRGYTGKPIYSTWFGSESEERAVFVDEVKCVGCLKCALFADKTFAIESVYGRARVVAQWADPEHKIHEAIETCPVDCISIVERSNLAALEFLMSKQPRDSVRMSTGNAVGARVSNIFVDVKKFRSKFHDAQDKASEKSSGESNLQREARMSAIQAIRSISNWLYWKSPKAGGGTTGGIHRNLALIAGKSIERNTKKLRDAAAAMRQARESAGYSTRRIPSNSTHQDEYWTPSKLTLPGVADNSSSSTKTSVSSHTREWKTRDERVTPIFIEKKQRNPLRWRIQTAAATVAAVMVHLQVGEGVGGSVKEHVGGSIALEIVNSSWLQVILAGLTWYLIGMAVVELVQFLTNKAGNVKDQ